jgi:hypothetical protein
VVTGQNGWCGVHNTYIHTNKCTAIKVYLHVFTRAARAGGVDKVRVQCVRCVEIRKAATGSFEQKAWKDEMYLVGDDHASKYILVLVNCAHTHKHSTINVSYIFRVAISANKDDRERQGLSKSSEMRT